MLYPTELQPHRIKCIKFGRDMQPRPQRNKKLPYTHFVRQPCCAYVFFAMIAPITAPAMIAVLTLPCEYFLPPLRFLR